MIAPKLYLNENLSWRLAERLRALGFDVVSSHEVDMNGEEDDVQMAHAVDNQRAIVTINFADYVDLHSKYISQGATHFGIRVWDGRNPRPRQW